MALGTSTLPCLYCISNNLRLTDGSSCSLIKIVPYCHLVGSNLSPTANFMHFGFFRCFQLCGIRYLFLSISDFQLVHARKMIGDIPTERHTFAGGWVVNVFEVSFLAPGLKLPISVALFYVCCLIYYFIMYRV